MITNFPCDVILYIGSQLDDKKDIVSYFSVLGHKLGRLELDEVARTLNVPYTDKLDKILEYSSMNIDSLVPEFILQDDIRVLELGHTLDVRTCSYPRIVRKAFSDKKYEQYQRDILQDIACKNNFEMLKVALEQKEVGNLLKTTKEIISNRHEELAFLLLEDGRCLKEEKAYFEILNSASRFRALGVLDFCLLFANFPSKEIREEEVVILVNSVVSSNSTLVAKRITNLLPGRDLVFFKRACVVNNLKIARYFFNRGSITKDNILKLLHNTARYNAREVFSYLYNLYSWEDNLKNELLVEALKYRAFERFVLLLGKGADPSYNRNYILHYSMRNNCTYFFKMIVPDERVRGESLRTSEVFDIVQVLGNSHCEIVSILFSEGILFSGNSSALLWSSAERNNHKLTRLYIDEGVILQEVKLRRLLDYTRKNNYRKTHSQLLRLWKHCDQTSCIEYLAKHGYYDLLREILTYNTNIGNALHLAIQGGYIRITRLLLKHVEVDSSVLSDYLPTASRKMTRLLAWFL